MLEVLKSLYTGLRSLMYCYVDDDWYRQPLMLGYTSTLDIDLGGTATGTSYAIQSASVPDDEVWTITNIAGRNLNHASSGIFLYIVKDSGAIIYLYYNASLAATLPFILNSTFVLSPGDKISLYIKTLVSGDAINGGVNGFITKKDL